MSRGRKARENMVREDATCVYGVTIRKFWNCWKPFFGCPSELLRIALLGPFINMDMLYGTESHVSLVSPAQQTFGASGVNHLLFQQLL